MGFSQLGHRDIHPFFQGIGADQEVFLGPTELVHLLIPHTWRKSGKDPKKRELEFEWMN